MNDRNISSSLAGKAWSFVRTRDLHGLWCAAKRRITDPDAAMIAKWRRDGCENTLRFDYPLTCESIVFDVGGYRGDFAATIAVRYDPYIYIFEPVPEFFELLTKRFLSNPKVRVYKFGLSNREEMANITLSDNGSSIYRAGQTQIPIQLRNVSSVWDEIGISRIDLIKINIEGGEYVLLSRMLEKGILPNCRDIQVQFHRFYPGARKLRLELRAALQKTHFLTYDYPFIWENWRKK